MSAGKSFEFATASRILFGPGTLERVGPLAAAMGERALVVVGQQAARAEPLLALLRAAGVKPLPFSVAHEPTLQQVAAGVAQAGVGRCGAIIGMGGGSVLDAGKAIAALLTNPGDPLDYLEGIGSGKTLVHPSAPYIAIPTTAGTGAEATSNAVLASPEHRLKVSLRAPTMLPRVAIVDPLLTHSLPPALTATTGLDALTQLIEPFVSRQATPLTDALCREGIARAARALPRAYADGHDSEAREGMALASLLGGMALANAKLGAVHGFAGVVGGRFAAPHGAICAALLPPVMAANVRALCAREPESPLLARYDEVARMLTGDRGATAADGIAWLQALCRDLHVLPLATYGVSEADVADITEGATLSSSMRGNPIVLSPMELAEILREAL